MLTPLDVENKRFSKQMMNGYSVEEVDEFLDEVAVDYTKKNKDLTEALRRVGELEKELEKYKDLESTLQNTLVMAQSTAEEVKSVARQQADQLITEAKSSVQRELNDLEQQIAFKRNSIDELQKQFDIYKAKMESLLISQLELIKEINKDN